MEHEDARSTLSAEGKGGRDGPASVTHRCSCRLLRTAGRSTLLVESLPKPSPCTLVVLLVGEVVAQCDYEFLTHQCLSQKELSWFYGDAGKLWLREALLAVHAGTGMPWWAVIVSTTLAAKMATFPLVVVSQRNAGRYLIAKPRMDQLLSRVRSKVDEEAFRYRWSSQRSKKIYSTNAARILAEIYSKYDFHPFRSISLSLAQVPIWVSLSVTIRRLCGSHTSKRQNADHFFPAGEASEINPDILTQGCLWFRDLSVSDPYFLLPLMLAAVNYLALQLHAMPFRGLPLGRLGKLLKLASYGSIMVLPIASAFVPTGLCFYWFTSSATNFLTYVIVKQPIVKRYYRIPMLPTDPQRPFRDLIVHILSQAKSPFLLCRKRGK